MKQFVLGADGGGSKTAVVILNEQGIELGRGISGAANYLVVGWEKTRHSLLTAMQAAAENAGIDLSQLAAATWALAGAGRPADAQILENLRAELLPGIPGGVVTDALAALVGGAGTRSGIVLIAGTGMIAYGENEAGEQARAGGWGRMLDDGSGYDLGRRVLRVVAQAHDGRGLPTRLTADVQNYLQIAYLPDVINWLYAPERGAAEIAGLTSLALAAATAGDTAATMCVAAAADALAETAVAVARRLGMGERPFPLVLAGGLLQNSDFYRRVVIQAIHTRLPQAQPMRPQAEAAVGAAWLALELLGRPLVSASATTERPHLAAWASEQRNVLTMDLDLHSTLEMVGLMSIEDGRAVTAVRAQLPAIARAIDAVADRMQRGGRLIYVGAGTSGRLGTLDASEIPPTFGTSAELVVSLMAGGETALVKAIEGAEDDREMGGKDLVGLGVGPLDAVVGIAASGRTPYVMGALAAARQRGALTIALVCNSAAPMATLAEQVIAPLVGPEVVSGSTRLKAGTAQKLVLNMLSTGVMVRLGKTYGNLMVDVAQHNVKLKERACRIVAQAGQMSAEMAAAAYAQSQGDVKTAVVSVLLGCTVAEAQQRLRRASGVVRTAVTIELRNVD